MTKLNLAVVAGGYSNEKVVSLKSLDTLMTYLNKDKYNLFKIIIDDEGWFLVEDKVRTSIDKTDFSVVINGEKQFFDFAFITIHGTPGEDGRLQAYFDLVGIPYSTPSYLASTVTSNKYLCNSFLVHNGFNCAKSYVIRKDLNYDSKNIISSLGLPCFVKPADGGSSFGVSKVSEFAQFEDAVNLAFQHGSEVMVESFVDGIEVTCGVYTRDSKVYSLAVTEIETNNDFFDYDAKYKGQSNEITPARISDEVTKKIQAATVDAYKVLNLKGMSRIDFIIQEGNPYLIEVNTTPGLSEQSIIPQQVRFEGYTLTEFFDWCVTCSMK